MFSSSNYNFWNINENEFDRQWSLENKIKFFIRYGILSPSCHNTQPWKFRIVDSSLEIYADYNRKLLMADPVGRGLYISLGACLENIVIAANYFGFLSVVQYEKNILKSSEDYHLVVRVKFTTKSENKKDNKKDLFSFISQHRTNKFNYIPTRTLPADFTLHCQQLLEDAQIKLYIGDSTAQINLMADLVGEATAIAFKNKNFRQELSLWMRNNFTSKGDGMPLFTNGLPNWLSFVVPILMLLFNPATPLSRKSNEAVKSSSGFGILGSAIDNTGTWIKIGQSFQRLNLFSRQLGVSLAIMGAPTEVGDYASKIREKFKLDFQPMLFFRIGYPQQFVRHTPRRNLDEVLIK